jgi:hypothetical protein
MGGHTSTQVNHFIIDVSNFSGATVGNVRPLSKCFLVFMDKVLSTAAVLESEAQIIPPLYCIARIVVYFFSQPKITYTV